MCCPAPWHTLIPQLRSTRAIDYSAKQTFASGLDQVVVVQVWLLAKSIFASLDSGYHQLVSHLLRTHVCQEPYILATNRCLSVMHPVSAFAAPC